MTGGRRVLRYEVPVDDAWHRVEHVGYVRHVASRDPGKVEFWAMGDEPSSFVAEFRVFGTGQPIDDGVYVGTAVTAGGSLVWHLFQREAAS